MVINSMRAVRSAAVETRPLEQRASPRRLVILGATGSIGRSCAEVVLASRGRFEVEALAGGRDGVALANMAIALGARFVAIADPESYGALKSGLAGRGVEIAAGEAAVREAALRQADVVVAAIVGGFNQARGAIVGGLVLGVVENLSAAYISAQYRGAFPMLLLVLVILFRPHGLFGRPEERTV